MALGQTDITTTKIRTETGIVSNVVSVLVGATGLSKYSYYAPGQLGVDGSKNITLTPPSSYKVGDFRLYNHSAVSPAPQADYTQKWGPAAGNFSFVISYMLSTLNIKAFTVPANYVTVKVYASAANRTSEASVKHNQTFAISFTADTPLTGHTRQSATKPSTTGWQAITLTNFDYSWLSDPDTTAYFDTYLSDVSGNRVINEGTSVSAGYTTVILHKNQIPYISAQNNNIPTPPSGYTAVFPSLYSASTPVCSSGPTIQQTFGNTSYSFYVFAHGVASSPTNRRVALTNAVVRLTLNGVNQTVYTGALSHTAGQPCSGTLAGGATWAYDNVATLTFITGTTIASTPAYTGC